jgi:hypothetical protein
MVEWHRLFGLVLMGFFTDSPFEVDVEKDLSHQQQRLDVLIIRKREGRFPHRLPDGLDNLAEHKLITFKSHQDTLDDWALKELTGHYVAYRKSLALRDAPLLPESAFGLYAVCRRFPHNLAQLVAWQRIQEGIYECRRGTNVIRVGVAGQLPQEEHNAPLHLFSASPEQVSYGAGHYQRRSGNTSPLLYQLFQGYQGEGVAMPYTMKDFQRDFIKEHFPELSPQEQRELLAGLSAEEQREVLAGLSPEQRLEGLSAEEIERVLQKRKDKRPSGASRRRRRSRR